MAPSITGQLVVTLTVTDLRRSADWYRELLTAREHSYVDDDGVLAQVTLTEPTTLLQICLVSHPEGSREAFTGLRPGLDHLEFLVADRADLDFVERTTRWARDTALGGERARIHRRDFRRLARSAIRPTWVACPQTCRAGCSS